MQPPCPTTRATCRLLCLAAGLLLHWSAPAATLTLLSPLDRQVFQRGDKDIAAVTIAGSIDVPVQTVEAKAELVPEALRGTGTDWMVVARQQTIVDGRFNGTLVLPTGGWYRLTVRCRAGGQTVAEASVAKIGVGDIFVMAGGACAANYGVPRQKATDDRVVYFDGKSFVPAADPIPESVGEGGTPWPILGDLLCRSTRAPICFRSATVNSLRVRDWLPGRSSGNFDRLVSRVKWLVPKGVRAVLWMQGEEDARRTDWTPTAVYERDLSRVISSLRKAVGYSIGFFVAGESFCPPPDEDLTKPNVWQSGIDAVLVAQKRVWKKGIAGRGPDTNDLIGPRYRTDGTHFGALGLRVLAERWYAVLSAHFGFANPITSEPGR